MENYVVVLFKNKIAKKILNKFITYKRAKLFFDNLVTQSNKVLFNVEVENGLPCEYEIAIIENTNAKLIPVYLTDEYGRNLRVKLEESGKTISEIVKYKKEEKLFDCQTNKKISSGEWIKKYLRGEGLKMISTLNNKIILQNDNEVKLFSLKNEVDCVRFADFLTSWLISNNRRDCLVVKDNSSAQRKYLFKLLSESGFDKKMLYRKSTTHPRQ